VDTRSTASASITLAAVLSGPGLRRFALQSRVQQDGTRQGEVTGVMVATASLERRFSVNATAVDADHVLQSQQCPNARAFS
jgi:hypothetical protein